MGTRAILTAYSPWRHRGLRHLRRMDPDGVYYLVVGGASTVVGVVVDAFTSIPWWRVTGIGLVGAWAYTWLTALDDVRRPRQSLRILAAQVRDAAHVRDPFEATRLRAALSDLPLYAPPERWNGARRLSGGGASYPAALLAPVQPTAEITWANGDARVSVRTKRGPYQHGGGGLPRGIDDVEDEPAVAALTIEELHDRLREESILVDGRAITTSVLDLSPEGLGWFAEARLDDAHHLELAGQHVEVADLELARVDPDHLAAPGQP